MKVDENSFLRSSTKVADLAIDKQRTKFDQSANDTKILSLFFKLPFMLFFNGLIKNVVKISVVGTKSVFKHLEMTAYAHKQH